MIKGIVRVAAPFVADWRRTLLGLLMAAAFGTAAAGFAGAAAHLIAASSAQELYSLAIGDHLLPGSPVESWLWGPLIIGFGVTWWVGISATPVFFGVAFAGGRPRFRTLLSAVVGAYLTGAIALGLMTWLRIRQGNDPGEGFLLALLDRGYLVLILVLVVLAGLLWFFGKSERHHEGVNDVTVVYAPDQERYEIRVGGKTVGHATARRRGAIVNLPHVEIDPNQRGKDLATILVREMLDDIRARGERIVALCPFVVTFLRRNAAYRDLVA